MDFFLLGSQGVQAIDTLQMTNPIDHNHHEPQQLQLQQRVLVEIWTPDPPPNPT